MAEFEFEVEDGAGKLADESHPLRHIIRELLTDGLLAIFVLSDQSASLFGQMCDRLLAEGEAVLKGVFLNSPSRPSICCLRLHRSPANTLRLDFSHERAGMSDGDGYGGLGGE